MDLHKNSIVDLYIKAILQKFILTEQAYSYVRTTFYSFFNCQMLHSLYIQVWSHLHLRDFTYVLLISSGLSNQ